MKLFLKTFLCENKKSERKVWVCFQTPGGSKALPLIPNETQFPRVPSGAEEGGVASPAHTCRELRVWSLKEKNRKTLREQNVAEILGIFLILRPEPEPVWSGLCRSGFRPNSPGSGSTWDRLKISQLFPEAGSERRRRHGESANFQSPRKNPTRLKTRTWTRTWSWSWSWVWSCTRFWFSL